MNAPGNKKLEWHMNLQLALSDIWAVNINKTLLSLIELNWSFKGTQKKTNSGLRIFFLYWWKLLFQGNKWGHAKLAYIQIFKMCTCYSKQQLRLNKQFANKYDEFK